MQELAFVLTDMLLMPCIDPTNEASPVSPNDFVYSKVDLEAVDKRLVHYTLLSMCPAYVKGRGSCLYFWERAMPHCCQWLKQHRFGCYHLNSAADSTLDPTLMFLVGQRNTSGGLMYVATSLVG